MYLKFLRQNVFSMVIQNSIIWLFWWNTQYLKCDTISAMNGVEFIISDKRSVNTFILTIVQ